eukprot:CAMPEP_0119378068 /NCGR_PEP_ID=MMETSP1334-20130426/47386_1 /TAXON_ID=127549 /ORGANISM="Calcidiscus leptoporus, Strain RCC1130" /LENGTH=89 /DNA_ID=CAMNT_0007397173 /DNA_START=112 /DNA_END=381 /DNA_ORIENTATION=+
MGVPWKWCGSGVEVVWEWHGSGTECHGTAMELPWEWHGSGTEAARTSTRCARRFWRVQALPLEAAAVSRSLPKSLCRPLQPAAALCMGY